MSRWMIIFILIITLLTSSLSLSSTGKDLITCNTQIKYSDLSTPISVRLFSNYSNIVNIGLSTKVKEKNSGLTIYSNTKPQIKTSNNRLILSTKTPKSLYYLPDNIILVPLNSNNICLKLTAKNKRCYKGSIELSSTNKKLVIINKVPFLDYIKSVTGSELPAKWPEEAVKAQVIAIHTYALHLIERQKELTDSTGTQFYGGTEYEKAEYNDYIKKVANTILTNDYGMPIEALYHSTCAGTTLNNEDVFGGNQKAYLRGIKCPYDSDSPFYKHLSRSIPLSVLKNKLKTNELNFIRNKNGQLKFILTDAKKLTPYQFWLESGQKLGWGVIPGIKYDIKCNNSHCIVKSLGAGHSVGMCQWGSRGMALRGFNYQDILRHYYKKVYFCPLKSYNNLKKGYKYEGSLSR